MVLSCTKVSFEVPQVREDESSDPAVDQNHPPSPTPASNINTHERQ